MVDRSLPGLLEAAVVDNVRWVEAVARASGVAGRRADGVWAALGATPPGYPEAVTTVPGVAPADVVAALPPGVRGRSVKDSWADVDLSGAGFRVLFEASWVARAPTAPASGGAWSVVAGGAAVAGWRRARGAAGAPDAPALLHGVPGVVLLGRGDASAPDAWAVATVRADLGVVGVSNVGVAEVGAREVGGVWPGLLAALTEVAPGLPVVGYESGDAFEEALAAGFEPLGPLRVWLEES